LKNGERESQEEKEKREELQEEGIKTKSDHGGRRGKAKYCATEQ